MPVFASSSSQPQILLLPDGGPQSRAEPWLARWQGLHGDVLLEQHDWQRPLRGDWSARLQETLVDAPGPVVLVASGLGCVLAAWWAAHSPAAAKVRGALLVAPTDVEQPALREQLPGWSPIALQRLPFPSILVGRAPHAACSLERAQALAQAWGATFAALDDTVDDPTRGDWAAGRTLLQTLLKD
ncbi:alpha/beta hydrolase [Pantoea sp. 18069]|uniref:RBBP9/YdeN family alpha/beta hydrolase n=1 Tax=Pantoea sp. 18069 TaxID=2681415 RepID=UPI001359DB65|nr:alpha/beta hydrolase [Pantoea sp. 18069]